MVGVSPEFLKEKKNPVPGRGFLASAIILLACGGAVGAWFFVAFEWRVGCSGTGDRLGPAPGSRQAFRCEDLGQRDARYFFAGLAFLGILIVAYAARRWMYGAVPNILMVFVVLLPVVLPYFGYLIVTRPSDECDQLAKNDLKASIAKWQDEGKQGPKPDFCQQV